MNTNNMSVKEAGRKGGQATKAKYGPDHYRELGSLGGKATKAKYGVDHYETIGRAGGQVVKKKRKTANS